MSRPATAVLFLGIGMLLGQPVAALGAVLGAWLADRAWRS